DLLCWESHKRSIEGSDQWRTKCRPTDYSICAIRDCRFSLSVCCRNRCQRTCRLWPVDFFSSGYDVFCWFSGLSFNDVYLVRSKPLSAESVLPERKWYSSFLYS